MSDRNHLEDHIAKVEDEEPSTVANGMEDAQAPMEQESSRDESPEAKGATRSTSGGGSQAAPPLEIEVEGKKPSMLKVIWAKLGLNPPTVIIMLKGSLPPLIGIAFYQSTSVSSVYGSLGYVVPIISIFSMAILPRAKFIQTLIFQLFGTLFGAGVAMFGIWSGIQARQNTASPGSTSPYNSSQSAVCAIWLFANIWIANLIRAKYPALQFPVIIYCIFINVAFTFGPLLPTIEDGKQLVRQLLETFLTASAVAAAVSLFVFPISSRTVVFKEMTGYIGAVRGTLKAQTAYLQSLEKSDMFSEDVTDDNGNEEGGNKNDQKPKQRNYKEAKALKDAVAGLTALHGKLHSDLPFGKREIAYGKLSADDLDDMFRHFQTILIPLVGMSTIIDIFERIAQRRGWVDMMQPSQFDTVEAWEHDPDVEAKLKEKMIWNDIMKQLHEPFIVVTQAMDEGLQHAGLLLGLLTPPKAKKASPADEVDVEAKGNDLKPGDNGFMEHLKQKLAEFYSKRGETLRTWAREKGLSLEEWDEGKSPGIGGADRNEDPFQHRRDQQQLYLILYMEFLLYSTGTAILRLISFAEAKVEDGTMRKNRLIHPGQRRLRKWLTSMGLEDSTTDDTSPDSLENGSTTVYLGSGFNKKRDPEHLPPTSLFQKCGNALRTIPHFLGSTESAFGFRAAVATMSIGIVAYLEKSQDFFTRQRMVWSLIIVAISMTVTAGQSVFGFLARVLGTGVSMGLSIVIWYIVDGKTPGVIVFLWLFIFIEYYLFLKFPRFISVWVVCIVTHVLILGYELQVRVIGIEAAIATGQPFYPIYELAPYRLAAVAGGCLVGFIWTILPYPLTDRSWLRKDLGSTIYLLANYYSVIHTTIFARMNNTEGDMEDKSSPGRRLEKVRRKVLGKLLLLLPSLRQHSEWEKWEPSIGGKFPKQTYDSIILRLTNIMNYLALMSYATQTWSTPSFPHPATPSRRAWLEDLSALLTSINPTSHSITSTLVLLSASVTQGSALPPYLQIPQSYQLSARLEKLDKGILSVRHVEEPGYSAYAVMQVASSLVTDDLRRLVEDVKVLVGEVDFTFKVVDGETSSLSDSIPGVGAGAGTGSGTGSGKGKVD